MNNSFNSSNGVFPDEVILQILARLPIKSLFKFRVVCKNWYKLPSDKYFIKLFNQISAMNSMVIVEITDVSERKCSLISIDHTKGVFEYSLDFMKDRVKVRSSCNGLLCCSSIPDKGVFYVCNPVTRQYRLLQKTRNRPLTRFSPDIDATLVGIGFNGVDDMKFNVVLAGYHRPFGHRPDNTFVTLVYDSVVNKWRKFVSLKEDGFTQMNRNQVVFVNGMLHWLTESYSCVLVLDLGNDVWRKIYLPDEIGGGNGNRMYLLKLEGCLSIIQISDSWMSIWVLKEYEKEEWRIVDRVSLRCIRGLVPGIFPISQTSECVFLATHKQVLFYDRRRRVWKEMYSVKSNATLPSWFSALPFRNTMFLFH